MDGIFRARPRKSFLSVKHVLLLLKKKLLQKKSISHALGIDRFPRNLLPVHELLPKAGLLPVWQMPFSGAACL